MADINFDFDSIVSRIITSLQSKSEWANILFLATNRRLIDATAEEMANLGDYATYLTSESKWSLAQNQSSLLCQASLLDYKPIRKQSSSGSLRLATVNDFVNYEIYMGNDIVIPKYTNFASSTGINFISTSAYIFPMPFTYIDIDIMQGTLKTLPTYTSQGLANEEIEINSTLVENSYFDITVNSVAWTQVTNLKEQSDTATVYEVITKKDFSGVYIRFGDNIYGKKLTSGWLVEVKYIETAGINGNILTVGDINKVVDTLYTVTGDKATLYCKNFSALYNGRNEYTTEEIKTNVPALFATGMRCCATEDYQTFILSKNSNVLKVIAWGGEDINEDAGNDFWTFIPSEENILHLSVIVGNSSAFHESTDAEELAIYNSLKSYKPRTDILNFEDPNIIYAYFISSVFVKSKSVNLTTYKTVILDSLETAYGISNMSFMESIKNSDYQALIDNLASVNYHNTTIAFHRDIAFTSSTLAIQTTLDCLPITETSLVTSKKFEVHIVYTAPGESSVTILKGYDVFNETSIEAKGTITKYESTEAGYDFGSTSEIIYNSGVCSISVTGIAYDYSYLKAVIYYQTTGTNAELSQRNAIFSFDRTLTSTKMNLYY